jgi:DNA-binding XRE family transcriptional regulator
MGRPTLEDFERDAFQDSEFKDEYERLQPVWELRRKMIKLRMEKGLSQAEVARKMGTKRSSISRLEGGEKVSFPTLATLSKYANALGCKVKVEFEPI